MGEIPPMDNVDIFINFSELLNEFVMVAFHMN